MKNYTQQKYLIAENVSSLPTTGLKNGRIVRYSRNLYYYDSGAWYFVSSAPDVTTQIPISANLALNDGHNYSTLIIGTSCTITVPDTLADNYQISGYVKAGQTLTFANSGTTFVGNNAVTTVTAKKTFTLVKINGTTEFILKIEG